MRIPRPRSAPRVRAAQPTAAPETDGVARVAGLLAVLAAIAALPAAELLPPAPAALAGLVTLGSAFTARRAPRLVRSALLRGPVALLAVLAVVALTFAAPGSAPLLPAAGEMPSGTIAACAAGALAAVVLEFAGRRGLLSGMVLCVAVLGLSAALATDDKQLAPCFAVGWPALLAALARAGAVPAGARPAPRMRRVPDDRGAWRSVVRWEVLPLVASIALACTVLVLLRLGGGWTGTPTTGSGGAGGTGAGAGGRAVTQYVGTAMDLRSRGDLSQDPVLRVPADSPSLWRGGWFDTYDGRTWTASANAPQAQRQVVRRDDDAQDTFTVTPGKEATEGPVEDARTDVVRPLVSWASVVLAPGPVRRVTSASFEGAGTAIAGPGDRVYLVGGDLQPYSVRSVVQRTVGTAPATVAPGRAAGDPDDERWTRLPATVPDRVLQLGRRLAAASPDRRSAVLAVENEIRARVEYTLDSPVPRRGEDAVDDVLFTSHEGFCEQFASAEVVLLRAAGIPARMATGFAAGRRDGSARVYRQADGHAWVEVWFPRVGWVTSDPTAGAVRSTTWWQDAVASARDRLTGDVPRPAWVLLGVFAVAVALLVRWRLRRPAGPEDGFEDEPPEPRLPPDLAAAFDRFQLALAETGRPRAPTESVAAVARRLRADPAAADASTARALDVVQRALYAAQPPPPADFRAAARALDATAARLLTAAREAASY